MGKNVNVINAEYVRIELDHFISKYGYDARVELVDRINANTENGFSVSEIEIFQDYSDEKEKSVNVIQFKFTNE